VVRRATGVVGVAAILLLIWLVKYRSNLPRRGLWPRCRVSRQRLAKRCTT
jgi:hypothetical protein